MITESLQACPFCGNTANTDNGKHRLDAVSVQRITKRLYISGETSFYRVKCGRCGARGGLCEIGYNHLAKHMVTEEEARERAIQKWNTREGSQNNG